MEYCNIEYLGEEENLGEELERGKYTEKCETRVLVRNKEQRNKLVVNDECVC